MKVLSLFDGMSCGQIALTELGVIPDVYYASEIDKHAIKQTQLNFPDTVQLGDVTRWMHWNIDWKSIDLILAGSPCQGFSFAGKQLAFDDPRSALFFEFVSVLEYVRMWNPDVKFLLENVRMKKENMAVITEYMGVGPVSINSNLVSAQNRIRFYWTNIPGVDIPEDRGVLLKDVLETDVDDKYYVSELALSYGLERAKRAAQRGSGFGARFSGDKANTILARDYKDGMGNLVYGRHGRVRRLTPTEHSRLQTVPDWYKWECSNTQQYKMCGNGWTVEVIKHILKNLV